MNQTIKSGMQIRERSEPTKGNSDYSKTVFTGSSLVFNAIEENPVDAVEKREELEVSETTKNPSLICSSRFVLAIVCFFGAMNNYALRINLSMALPCMVRLPYDQIYELNSTNQSFTENGFKENSLKTSPKCSPQIIANVEASKEVIVYLSFQK